MKTVIVTNDKNTHENVTDCLDKRDILRVPGIKLTIPKNDKLIYE